MLTASLNCIRLIKTFEGLRLKSYLCPAGVATIGYGQTGENIKLGMTITEAEASALLIRDLSSRARKLNEQLDGAKTTQAQFDAMLSLAFNIGTGNFAKSSVLRFHKAGEYAKAEAAFHMWTKATVNGKRTVLRGLVRRREAEAQLYGSEKPSK